MRSSASAATGRFPWPPLLVFGLVIQGTYRVVERVFLLASALYVVYIVSALLAHPPWGAILRQTVRPSFSLQGGYLITLITIVGTTIAPWMQFYLQSSIVDKGVRLRDLRWARLDAYVGSAAAGLIAFFIIVACGATLFPNGVRVETAKDAALALEPFAGHYATILFAFGLLNASVFSAAILPLSTAYAVCEALGWETGVDRRPREAPGFFIIYTLMILAGGGPDSPASCSPGGHHVLVPDIERSLAALGPPGDAQAHQRPGDHGTSRELGGIQSGRLGHGGCHDCPQPAALSSSLSPRLTQRPGARLPGMRPKLRWTPGGILISSGTTLQSSGRLVNLVNWGKRSSREPSPQLTSRPN